MLNLYKIFTALDSHLFLMCEKILNFQFSHKFSVISRNTECYHFLQLINAAYNENEILRARNVRTFTIQRTENSLMAAEPVWRTLQLHAGQPFIIFLRVCMPLASPTLRFYLRIAFAAHHCNSIFSLEKSFVPYILLYKSAIILLYQSSKH